MAERGHADQKRTNPMRVCELVHRAFAEFLKLPTLIVAGFLVLAAVTTFIDHTEIGWLRTLRAPIHDRRRAYPWTDCCGMNCSPTVLLHRFRHGFSLRNPYNRW